MFYIKCKSLDERTRFIDEMRKLGIGCVFHYVPLHSAPAGFKFGRFHGNDEYTTVDSDRLVRLPMYYNISKEDLKYIIDSVLNFYKL